MADSLIYFAAKANADSYVSLARAKELATNLPIGAKFLALPTDDDRARFLRQSTLHIDLLNFANDKFTNLIDEAPEQSLKLPDVNHNYDEVVIVDFNAVEKWFKVSEVQAKDLRFDLITNWDGALLIVYNRMITKEFGITDYNAETYKFTLHSSPDIDLTNDDYTTVIVYPIDDSIQKACALQAFWLVSNESTRELIGKAWAGERQRSGGEVVISFDKVDVQNIIYIEAYNLIKPFLAKSNSILIIRSD